MSEQLLWTEPNKKAEPEMGDVLSGEFEKHH